MRGARLLCGMLCLGFALAAWARPLVLMKTSLGDVQVELYSDKAPVTVANFLRYVDEQRYADGHFYRVVNDDNQPDSPIKIAVVQGGLGLLEHPLRLPAIEHESTRQTGVLHLDGTLSMARLAPGTADAEFFICVGSQPELDFGGQRNPDGQGFAAFGRVVSGMELIRHINGLPSQQQILFSPVALSLQRMPKNHPKND